MAWFTPFTAVDGTVFTAAQFNTFVRDNLSQTEVGLASVPSAFFSTAAYNQVTERISTSDFTTAVDTTTSTSYTDLDNSIGPVVTVNTGVMAFVAIYTDMQNTANSNATWMTYDIGGASSVTGDDHKAVQLQGNTSAGKRPGAVFLETGLTPGLNTFTAKYRVSTSGTGSFDARRLAVFPL